LGSEAQETIRKLAVQAVESGMPQIEAGRKFGVARGTVAMWMKHYREGGTAALTRKRKGRPGGKYRLGSSREARIIRFITDRTPDQLKLPFMLWTREAVQSLITRQFGINVSLMTTGRWLKRWGFTPQKPVRRAFEQDPEAIKRWLENEYPGLRASAKREGAEIHWGDEMGLRSDHQAGRSYSLKGQTPVIRGTGKRFGCQMISSLTNRGTLRFMVFKTKFRAGVFIKFLNRLIRGSHRKIYLIVDRHPVHKSRRVKRWLLGHKDKLLLFYLPAYAPELNPDEYLNHDVKANAVGRRRASDQDDMVADVRGYMRSTQRQPQVVKRFFHPEPVRYAMA